MSLLLDKYAPEIKEISKIEKEIILFLSQNLIDPQYNKITDKVINVFSKNKKETELIENINMEIWNKRNNENMYELLCSYYLNEETKVAIESVIVANMIEVSFGDELEGFVKNNILNTIGKKKLIPFLNSKINNVINIIKKTLTKIKEAVEEEGVRSSNYDWREIIANKMPKKINKYNQWEHKEEYVFYLLCMFIDDEEDKKAIENVLGESNNDIAVKLEVAKERMENISLNDGHMYKGFYSDNKLVRVREAKPCNPIVILVLSIRLELTIGPIINCSIEGKKEGNIFVISNDKNSNECFYINNGQEAFSMLYKKDPNFLSETYNKVKFLNELKKWFNEYKNDKRKCGSIIEKEEEIIYRGGDRVKLDSLGVITSVLQEVSGYDYIVNYFYVNQINKTLGFDTVLKRNVDFEKNEAKAIMFYLDASSL